MLKIVQKLSSTYFLSFNFWRRPPPVTRFNKQRVVSFQLNRDQTIWPDDDLTKSLANKNRRTLTKFFEGETSAKRKSIENEEMVNTKINFSICKLAYLTKVPT